MHHLDQLEAEAVHVIREVAAELERPVLLFSGGKDSIVLLHLARKAFRPGVVPFPVMHVDTGHNFPEVIEFRDRHVPEVLVASVQESIDRGRVRDEPSRNRLQTTTLLDAIEEHRFDAAFGAGHRPVPQLELTSPVTLPFPVEEDEDVDPAVEPELGVAVEVGDECPNLLGGRVDVKGAFPILLHGGDLPPLVVAVSPSRPGTMGGSCGLPPSGGPRP